MWSAENLSFLAASCCIVEVINGGLGFLFIGFLFISEIEKFREFTSLRISCALNSEGISNFFNLVLLTELRFAFTASPDLVKNFPVIDQYSWGSNISLSASLSQINLRATD